MSLRDGWRFKLGPESATELRDEPDSTWTTVSVPHTWNRAGYYKDAPVSHINTAQNVVTTQGVGWYKLVFTPPANVAGMESFLQFDAASRIATVWLNGTFEGGIAQVISGPGSGFRAPAPASIAGTTSPLVAATYRAGSFTYRVPVADGPHSVVLTFVEPSLHPGERIFDVFANGQKVLTNLDVAGAAGGALTAYRQHFEVDAKDGIVVLNFRPTKGDAIVSAIEVQ
jgi:hypothetical protein